MTDENKAPLSAFEKTDQLVNAAGARIGKWAGRVVRRMQSTARSLSQEAHVDTAGVTHRKPLAERPTVQRAEALVNHLGQSATRWTQEGSMRLRRGIAHVREDMEDMWVEAQAVQHHRPHTKPRAEIHEEPQ